MENTGGKDQCDRVDEAAGLFAASASEGINSEEERQDKATWHPRNEVLRHASVTSAGVGTHCGNHCRAEFLWVQAGTINRRCREAMFQFPSAENSGGVGAGGRHQGLLRQYQSRLDDCQHPHGQGSS